MFRQLCFLLSFLLPFQISAHAGAPEIQIYESNFVSYLILPDGSERDNNSRIVPNIAKKSCFGWLIKHKRRPGIAQITETLTLPSVPTEWANADKDTFAPTIINPDRKSATVNHKVALDKGEFTSIWCIAKGDPSGEYFFEVRHGKTLLAYFDFVVK